MSIRATVTIKPSKGKTFALSRYCSAPKKEHAAAVGIKQATEERLVASFGIGLRGINLTNAAAVTAALEQRTKVACSRNGKMHRHITFSLVGEKTQKEGIAALKQLGKDWQAEFCPQNKVAFYIHGDSSKLHMHALVEAYDPRIYKRHDWDQRKDGILSKMLDMEYTSAVSPGKGNRLTVVEKKKYATKQTPHSIAVEVAKKERSSKDKKLSAELVNYIKSTSSRPNSESELLELLKIQLPDGWTLRHKTKSNTPLRRPSISSGNTTIRLGRFWSWLRDKSKIKKKGLAQKNGKCGSCGKPKAKCSCGDRIHYQAQHDL